MSLSQFALYPVVQLREIIKTLESGSRPSGGVSSFEHGIPSISGEHISHNGDFDFTNIRYIPETYFHQLSRGIIQTSDILLVKDGATTGKVAFVREDFPFQSAAVNEHVFIIRVDIKLVEPEYLFFFIYSSWGKFQIQRSFQGAAIGGINSSFIDRFEVPLPTLPEQRHIVEILRQADALRRLQTRYELSHGNMPRTLFDGFFGGPNFWKKTEPLATYVQFKGGGTPSRKLKHYFEGNIPWVTPKDMGERFISDSIEHISEEAIADSATQLVPANTLLVVVKSKILVHTLPLSIVTRSCAFNQDVKGLICHDGVDVRFIYGAIQAQVQLILRQARGANTEGLTLDMLRQLRIPVVDTRALNAFLDAIGIFDLLANKNVQRNRQMNSLAQSLFGQAFSGLLTQQWRSTRAKELSDFAVQRDVALGLRGEEPSQGDYKRGRVTQGRHEGIERRLLDASRSMLNGLISSQFDTVVPNIFSAIQADWGTQFANIFGAAEQIKIPDFSYTVSDSLRNAVLGMDGSAIFTLNSLSSGVADALTSMVQSPLSGVLSEFTSFFEGGDFADHPRDHVLDELTEHQLRIFIACPKAPSYELTELTQFDKSKGETVQSDAKAPRAVTVQGVQEAVGLSMDIVRRGLALLASLGLLAVVSVPAESADGLTFVAAYRSVGKSDDVRLADLALLKEADQP